MIADYEHTIPTVWLRYRKSRGVIYSLTMTDCHPCPGNIHLCLRAQSATVHNISRYFLVRLKQFPVSAFWLPVFDIFWAALTNSPRNNLTGHFLPKFWHILPEISSKKIFVLKGLMNKNFFHFLFLSQIVPPWGNCWTEYWLLWSVPPLSVITHFITRTGPGSSLSHQNSTMSSWSELWALGWDEAGEGERALAVFSWPAGGSPLAAKGLSASC